MIFNQIISLQITSQLCGGRQKILQNFKNWMFRQLNEKIFRFERSFIDPHGLPDRLQFKHVIFAPSSSDTYSSAALPGLDSRLSVQNFHWPMGTIDESVPFAGLKWESYKPFMMQCIILIGPTISRQKMWKNNSQRSGRF